MLSHSETNFRLDPDEATNKRTWGGTKAQFFDLYEITAKHLKSKFPHLKIGGPALAGNMEWGEEFLKEMHRREVPIDFFSWHIYATNPEKIAARAEKAKQLLLENGYEHAESILNEWNYVKGWEKEFKYSIMMIHGLKSASFILSTMALSQVAPLDMLMYYDTRPGAFCGIFDIYSYDTLKGYYALYWYAKFYDLEAEIRSENTIPNVYTLCGTDKEGKVLCAMTHYSDDDNAAPKEVKLDFGRSGSYEIYLVDEDHNGELVTTTSDLTFTIPVHTCMLIQEV